MGSLTQDLRFALRTLAKAPVFTAVAVVSLALGIGANTAIFTLLDQVVLRLLPVSNPEQLVLLTTHGSHYGNNRGANAFSYPMYKDFRDQNQVFSGTLCRYETPLSMSFNGRTERISGELVSGNYFQVLGVGAALGRVITPGDDRTAGGHPLVVLSYGFWKTRFASDPSIIGKTLHINGYPMTVIGVSQDGFSGVDPGESLQVRIPVMMKAQMTPGWDDLRNRRSRWVNVYGRLKPGITIEQAKASLQPVFHRIIEMEVQEPAFSKASTYTRQQFLKSTIDVLPGAKGWSALRREFSKPLWVLMGIVWLVLLIACANIANLLIARAASRQKEVAVRLALGASRFRIVRQLLVESVLLAVFGGAMGLVLASWTDDLLIRFLPVGGRALTVSSTPDLRILAFTFGVALITGIVFGMVPALQSTRPDLAPTLKDQAGGVLGGSSQAGFRKVLVVSQIALSLLLLIGAGLFIRSLQNLRSLNPGFQVENLLEFSVDASLNGYSRERRQIFYRELMDDLSSLPGIRAAGLASVPILRGWEWDSTVTVEGYAAKPGEDMNPYFNSIGPGYFATLGIPILAGRAFSWKDEASAPEVAIVNKKFARHYFGNGNPIGRHIGRGGDPGTKTDTEIVGVIGDCKYTGVRDEIPRQVYVPIAQEGSRAVTVYVRTTRGSEEVFAALRREVRKLDPNLPIYDLRTLEAQLDESLATDRLIAGLSTAFGLLATLLAIIGLYGVMAYAVARRAREIGIRMALGAARGTVLWLVMREVVTLVGLGVVIGLPAAWGVTQLVRTQLYGITPNDSVTLAGATLVLAVVALLAGYIPALRATRVDPMEVLRYE